jgi:hypothetical protein
LRWIREYTSMLTLAAMMIMLGRVITDGWPGHADARHGLGAGGLGSCSR